MTPTDENVAVARAVRALRARDHTSASLDRWLERRGIQAGDRALALQRVRELGYLDDERAARGRAEALAARGRGDLLIAADLEARGVEPDVARAALDGLEPERERAAAIVAREGVSARTARLLATRGFSEDTVGDVVAALGDEPLG